MNTTGNSSGYGFGTMLRHELSSLVMWLMAGAIVVLVWFIGQPGFLGVLSLIVICILVAGISAGLVQRTPWCSDTAFWRTRPVSRRMLFVVKSIAMVVLCAIPLMLVAVVGMSGFDQATSTAVLVLAAAGVVGVTASVASATAIGSLGGRWKAAGWQAVFVAPVVTSVVLLFMRNYFPIPTPQGPGGGISALMLGFSIAAFGGVVAWLVVGMGGRAVVAFWILLGTAVVWSSTAFTFRGNFFKVPKAPAVSLELKEAVAVLRAPGAKVVDLEDDWFVPSYVSVSWRDRWKENSFRQGLIGRAAGNLIRPDSQAEAFSKNHRDFSSVVDVEKLWKMLRATLPSHENWVPSERTDRELHSNFALPPSDAFEPGAAEIDMGGSLFRFHPLTPVRPEPATMESLSRERLEIVKVGVPNEHAIGLDLAMSGSILEQSGHRLSLSSADPPEVWGILYHEKSRTAYGTASLRGRNSPNGLSELVLWSSDLHLRFELPRMESALLGLEPERILSESVLHLFVVERTAFASVDSAPVTR